MRLLTCNQASELDRISMVEKGIASKVLMGNAGKCVSKKAEEIIQDLKDPSILVLCGKGNNGGDGFAAASELYHKKYSIHIHSIVDEENINGDSVYYFQDCVSLGIPITFGMDHSNLKAPDLIIDALLGTGLKGAVRQDMVPFINWINENDKKVISIDIPSGLNGNSGIVDPISVKADETITFGAPKLGMYFRKGPEFCGNVALVDIGFPKINTVVLPGLVWDSFNEDRAKESLSKPKLDMHKYDSGKVLIIAGSSGMTGAAILSTYGALRSGAGLTITTSPRSLNDIYERSIIEGMTLPLDDNSAGVLSINNFDSIMEKVDWADSVLLGPGLGRENSTQELIKHLVRNVNKPLILDADGLFPFSDDIDQLNEREYPLIITPHFGELARLKGIKTKALVSEFPDIITDLMQVFDKTVLAKQVPVCVFEGNEAIINTSGNPGLATAGTGDVLAGMISGFLSQGHSNLNAATLGAFIHGKASDIIASEKGYRGQIASDLLAKVPDVIKEYERA